MPESYKSEPGFKKAEDFMSDEKKTEKSNLPDGNSDIPKNGESKTTSAPVSGEALNPLDSQKDFEEFIVPQQMKPNGETPDKKKKKNISKKQPDQTNKQNDGNYKEISLAGEIRKNEKTVENGYVALFGSKLKISAKLLTALRIAVPLVAVLVCAIFVFGMLGDTLNAVNNIEGKFEIVDVISNDYIDLNSDGTYTMSGSRKGKWSLEGAVFKFRQSTGETLEGRFVNRKYIVLVDEKFYSGEVSGESWIDASLIASDQSSILLNKEGVATAKYSDRSEQIGTYMIDGSFIVITLGDTNTTYIKCSDGISSVYYQI